MYQASNVFSEEYYSRYIKRGSSIELENSDKEDSMPILTKTKLAVGVGQGCNVDDSYQAGCDAARGAIQNHGGAPEALVVFAAPAYQHRKVLDGIVSVTGALPMVGGTTAGEIGNSGFVTQSVVVMALSSDSLEFHTSIGLDMSIDEEACGTALAKDLISQASKQDPLSLLVFPNGMGGDGIRVIDGLHAQLGTDFEIVGGHLGDEENFEQTYQFYNGQVYKDAIPGLMISGKSGFKTGIGVMSGFESIGIRCICTKAEGNTLKELDGEPALKLYQEFLGDERSKQLPGICLEYPFGLIDGNDTAETDKYFQLRCGLGVDHEEGSITLAASIPEGSALTLTTATRQDVINGARLAAERAKEGLEGSQPRAIMMFSCVGRKLVLGRRTQEEVLAVKEVLGEDVPLIGFYTYGEIGPISKQHGDLTKTKFHNETVVLWVLGEDAR